MADISKIMSLLIDNVNKVLAINIDFIDTMVRIKRYVHSFMYYSPPAGNAVSFAFAGGYSPPSGDAIDYPFIYDLPPEEQASLHTARFFSNPSNDSQIWNNAATFSAARDATTGTELFSSQANGIAQASYTGYGGDNEYGVARTFSEFDLSSFTTEGRTVQSVTLGVGGYGYSDTSVALFTGTQSSPPTMSDFDSYGSSLSNDTLAWVQFDGDGSVHINTFTFNSGGISYLISKMGDVPKVCFREAAYDVANATPTTTRRDGMYFGNAQIMSNNTTGEYYNVGPMLFVNYLKIPVWTSVLNDTKWMPANSNPANAVWTGSAWTAGTSGDLFLSVKTGSTWANGYRPSKMRITFTGTINTLFWLYLTTQIGSHAFIGDISGITITSGQVIDLPWYYPESVTFKEMFFNNTSIVVTNIEFLER